MIKKYGVLGAVLIAFIGCSYSVFSDYHLVEVDYGNGETGIIHYQILSDKLVNRGDEEVWKTQYLLKDEATLNTRFSAYVLVENGEVREAFVSGLDGLDPYSHLQTYLVGCNVMWGESRPFCAQRLIDQFYR